MRLRQSQNKIFKKCRTLKMCLNASLSLDSLLLLFLEGRGEWTGTDFVTSVDNEYETEHTAWDIMNNRCELLRSILKVVVFSWNGQIVYHVCLFILIFPTESNDVKISHLCRLKTMFLGQWDWKSKIWSCLMIFACKGWGC